jgi:hypothetical protein
MDFEAFIMRFIAGSGLTLFGFFLVRYPQRYLDWNISRMMPKDGKPNILARHGIKQMKNTSPVYMQFIGGLLLILGMFLVYAALFLPVYHPHGG